MLITLLPPIIKTLSAMSLKISQKWYAPKKITIKNCLIILIIILKPSQNSLITFNSCNSNPINKNYILNPNSNNLLCKIIIIIAAIFLLVIVVMKIIWNLPNFSILTIIAICFLAMKKSKII